MSRYLKDTDYRRSLTEVFLGKNITVKTSGDISVAGLQGIVWDETKNMFLIKTDKGIKKVQKQGSVFVVETEIYGDDICYTLADRIKKYG